MTANEILDKLVSGQIKLSQAMQLTRIMLSQDGDDEMVEWVTNECNGYNGKLSVPAYRQIPCQIYAKTQVPYIGTREKLVNARELDESCIKHSGASLYTMYLMQGIESIEAVSEKGSKGVISMAFPEEIEKMFISALSTNGKYVSNIYQQASASYIPHVIASVKNELINKLISLTKHKAINVTAHPLSLTIQSGLSQYPDVKKLYDKAIEGFDNGTDYRHALDDLRLSLETLLKRVLGNDKSMENQSDVLCEYLGKEGISSEIIGNVKVNLTTVSRYFNEHEKHKDNVKLNEIDYIVTAVNNIMNILL